MPRAATSEDGEKRFKSSCLPVFHKAYWSHVSILRFGCWRYVDVSVILRRLKPLDIEIMKRLGTRVNLIPVVAKADTLTQNDLFVFKQRVREIEPPAYSCFRFLIFLYQIREVIAAQGIRIYQPPVESDDESSADHARILTDAIPFSIIGSTEDVQTPDGRIVKGREYLWGVAEGHYLFTIS